MKKLFLLLALSLLMFPIHTEDRQMAKPLEKYVLYPAVKIECERGHGSGIVMAVGDGMSVILTARHVIDGFEKCRVTMYPSEVQYPGEIIRVSETHDLALIQVLTEHEYVASMHTIEDVATATTVWKSGAGLGHRPHIAKGFVGDHLKHTLMTTSTVAGGDSGGGIFIRTGKTYSLIGIITAHPVELIGTNVEDEYVHGHIHHITYAQNMRSIYEFVTGQ